MTKINREQVCREAADWMRLLRDATEVPRELAMLDLILARLASTSPEPDGAAAWRPIETAPKTGEDIQVYCADTNEQFSAYWHISREVWAYAVSSGGLIIACNPTHWMRQVAAPQPVVEKDHE